MTPEEKYDDIKDLYETTRISEARTFLALGWRLLKIVQRPDEGERTSYVFGWPSGKLPSYPDVDYFPVPKPPSE